MLTSQEHAGRLTKAHASSPLGFGRQIISEQMDGNQGAGRQSTKFQGWVEATNRDASSYI